MGGGGGGGGGGRRGKARIVGMGEDGITMEREGERLQEVRGEGSQVRGERLQEARGEVPRPWVRGRCS